MIRLSSDKQERGAFIPMLAALIMLVLFGAAFAVDFAIYTRTKAIAKKATDAALLAGMGFRSDNGWGFLHNPPVLGMARRSELMMVMAGIANDNLEQVGLGGDPEDPEVSCVPIGSLEHCPGYLGNPRCSIKVKFGEATFTGCYYSGADEHFTAKIEQPVNFFFAKIIPGLEEIAPAVETSLSGELNRATVGLMLDASNSMGCPETGGCACQKLLGGCPLAGFLGNLRVDRLREAAVNFVEMFNPYRDTVSVVSFRSSAKIMSKPRRLSPGFNPLEIINAINKEDGDLQPGGGTNICDAFYRSEESLKALLEATSGTREDADVSWVLFTDGAPTAGRFQYTGGYTPPSGGCNSGSSNCLPWNVNEGEWDYYQYKVSWEGGLNGLLASLVAPSPLVRAGIDPYWEEPWFPYEYKGGDPNQLEKGAIPACSLTNEEYLMRTDENNRSQTFNRCLRHLGFRLPNGEASAQYAMKNTTGDRAEDRDQFKYWEEQYYNCAIVWSDYLRDTYAKEHRVSRVYTIGLGSPIKEDCTLSEENVAPEALSAEDPYQCVGGETFTEIGDVERFLNFARKDIFLTRLARDGAIASRGRHPNFQFEPAYLPSNSYYDGSKSQGRYVATNNPQELKFVFSDVARSILMNLSE